MMKVKDVIQAMERIAPLHYAAEWDNVGLLVGSAEAKVDRTLLTIDLTAAVVQEAIETEAELIIAYHPPIFSPMKALTDHWQTASAYTAAAAGMAVYSPHTALDAAPGGINDWLAACLGAGDCRSLESHESLPESEQFKIITFCPADPPDVVERIRNGLASVGAGRIGEYELCSFEIPGTGTFRGTAKSDPTIGEPGVLERVNEVRLEMVCPGAALGLAVMTLRQFHPYEEPPIEILKLQPRPQRNIGQGRRVVLDEPLSLRTISQRLKQQLGVKQVQAPTAPPPQSPAKYETVGLCAGAGGSLLHAAIDQGCRLFITGEMRHHDVLAAQARGCSVLLAGHTNTERGYLKVLRKKLAEQLKGLTLAISKRDGDPLKLM